MVAMGPIRRAMARWNYRRHARAHARTFPPLPPDTALAAVRTLRLPQLLETMLEMGRWVHPGDDLMRAKVSFIRDPLEFQQRHEWMIQASAPLLGRGLDESKMFSEYRGSKFPERDLPWLDVEKRLNIIVSREIGDDTCIALDYRTGLHAPRVVGCDWINGGCVYREISPSFEAFVDLLGLQTK